VTTMKYEKPEVKFLGKADRVIQAYKPGTPEADGGGRFTNNPAYELDE